MSPADRARLRALADDWRRVERNEDPEQQAKRKATAWVEASRPTVVIELLDRVDALEALLREARDAFVTRSYELTKWCVKGTGEVSDLLARIDAALGEEVSRG